jgi:hypothetical protein
MGSPAPGRTFNLDEHLQEEQTIDQSHGHTPIEESDEEDGDIDIIGDLRDPENHGQRDSQNPTSGPSRVIPATQAPSRNLSEDRERSETYRAFQGAPAGSNTELNMPGRGGVTPDLRAGNQPVELRSPLRGSPAGGTNQVPFMVPTYSGNFLEALLMKVFQAEDAGAPVAEVQRLQRQVELARLTLAIPSGTPTERQRSAGDEASRLMNTLSKVTPKPRLGSDSRVPTPQQVAQWATDVETMFRSVHAIEDSDTRTYWALNTIQYNVHRELLQQKINEGLIRTWDGLLAEQRRLVQDPVLTKFQNYSKFFNFTWRDGDLMNSFMLQLGKRESLLERSFFKLPNGADDDELKIAFIWSKVPESYRRELQRNGSLEAIHTWEEFERALRNAETALEPAGPAKTPRGAAEGGQPRGKRNASGQSTPKSSGKKQDRKPSSSGFQRRQSPGDDSSRNQSRSSRRDSHGEPSERPWENKNSHWRNKDQGDARRQDKGPKKDHSRDDTGKDKP